MECLAEVYLFQSKGAGADEAVFQMTPLPPFSSHSHTRCDRPQSANILGSLSGITMGQGNEVTVASEITTV